MADLVIFKVGNWEAYNGLAEKDANTLYFVEDRQTLYKGEVPYGGNAYEIVSTDPESPRQGVLYINGTTGETKYYNGSGLVTLIKQYATAISGSGNDNESPTTKAVVDYVTNRIAEVVGGTGAFITAITPKPNGVINVAKGEENEDVTLTGVVTDPIYEQETRKITLPIAGKEALVIELGKDLAVRGGKYNTDSQEIWLTLDESGSYDVPNKVIKIPAADLVDVYTGGTTDTAKVTVSGENVIKVDVQVSTKAGNALSVDSSPKTKGLYVDVSGKLDKLAGDRTDEIVTAAADGTIQPSGKKVGTETLNGVPDANTVATEVAVKTYADSVANTAKTNAIEAAKSYTDTAKQEAISTAAADASSKDTEILRQAKEYTDAALTWNTIA